MVITSTSELDWSNEVVRNPKLILLNSDFVDLAKKFSTALLVNNLNPSSMKRIPNSRIATPAPTSLNSGLK